MENPKHLNPSKGFTAVETVVAAVLMFSTIAGMLQLISQGQYQIELARDHTHATQLLQNEIEELRSQNWDDIAELPNYTAVQTDEHLGVTNNKTYQLFRQVADDDSLPNHRHVTVFCTWTDSRGKDQKVQFKTQFSKNGLNDYYYRAVQS